MDSNTNITPYDMGGGMQSNVQPPSPMGTYDSTTGTIVNQPMVNQPSMQAPMPYEQPNQMMESGGSVSKDFFKDINYLDLGIMMLGTAALFYTIYYYRIKMKTQQRELVEVLNRMDMIDAKVSGIQKSQKDLVEEAAKKEKPKVKVLK